MRNRRYTIGEAVARKAEQVIVSPTEELNIVCLEEYLPELLEGRVVAKGNTIPTKEEKWGLL